MVVAFLLSEAAYRIDRSIEDDGSSWFLFAGGTDSARALVSTIATSMLTFTGLVFSVTMLVLQLASNQLSPRVMRTFLRDRSNQVVFGVFVGTFLYALATLRRITAEADSEPFIPALSVWLALAFVLVCIGLFIYYIDHIANAIKPVSVMARVSKETHGAIDRLYPDGIGEDTPVAREPRDRQVSAVILAPGSGVVTGVDEGQIAELAARSGCMIMLQAHVGDFVRQGSPLFAIHGDWNGDGGQLQRVISLGWERTMHQDAAFGLQQLVDIALRALSPGINDPTTAVQALDHLHDLLGRLATRAIPSPYRDMGGEAGAVLPRLAWADYVNLACDDIRRAGHGQLQIQRRMRAMLADLLAVAPPSRHDPLEEQLSMLDTELEKAFGPLERLRAATPSAQGQGPA
ncbi:MAG: DUF2254 domain-containing protein [Gemmatimonadaceae bacterium]|nr:DUF2254 domain-containing protein [Gemmatimonadaceae bacterium]